jgi:fumarylacetoacetase
MTGRRVTIQAYEYQPLGPFLSKNFGSTLAPWW